MKISLSMLASGVLALALLPAKTLGVEPSSSTDTTTTTLHEANVSNDKNVIEITNLRGSDHGVGSFFWSIAI